MSSNHVPSFDRMIDFIRTMTASNAFLVFGLLLVSALVHPYTGLVHDARLYSLQVANRVDTAVHQQDLFFAGGSQDDFSIFSPVMTPLVTLMGLEHAFWLCWLAATAVLVYAEVLLVKRLVPHPLMALLALVLVTTSAVPYGGNGVFHVHESFLTARLPAEALVLLALVQVLDGRHGRGVLLCVLAMLFHPLMGIWGLATVVTCAVAPLVSPRTLWTFAAACCLGLGLLLWLPDLAYRFLGRLDTEWFWASYQVSGHCFLTEWTGGNWLNLVAAVTTVLAACRYLQGRASRLCLVTVLFSVAGLAIALVAHWTGCALLLQGQGYRALWVLQTLAVILAAPVSWHLLSQGRGWEQLVGLAIAGHFFGLLSASLAAVSDGLWTYVLIASAIGGMIFFTTAWSVVPRASQAVMGTLVALGLMYSLSTCIDVLGYLPHSTSPPVAAWQVVTYVTCPLLWSLCGLAVLAACFHYGRRGRKAIWTAFCLWVAISAGTHLVRSSPGYQHRYIEDAANVRFVRAWIESHRAAGRATDQVYWPTDPTHIWHGLGCNSYYSWAQIQGVLFSREVAVEAQRRGRLVGVFEMTPGRSPIHISERARAAQYRLARTHRVGASPSADDLTALAADPLVDWIVLPYHFDGLAAASNGHVHIYQAESLRRVQRGADGHAH